jgi:hypothetical protein
MFNTKGKYASSTENRRLVWDEIIWPLILEKDRPYFTIEEYRIKRDLYCKEHNISLSKIAGGFVSLIIKNMIIKGSNHNIYSIHYKLIPYLRKKIVLSYGQAAREVSTK